MKRRLKKRRLKIISFLILGILVYFTIKSDFIKNNSFINNMTDNFNNKIQQGTITIKTVDAKGQFPIKNVEYIITEIESGEIIEVLFTNEDGIASTGLLNYGTLYEIKQMDIMMPYKLISDDTVVLEISEVNHEIIMENTVYEFVKDYVRTEEGDIIINEVYIDVPTIMQEPELPNGCEITSLTSVLNYYGYNVCKTEMSDVYLLKDPFYRRDGKLFGANPYVSFSGDPRDPNGWFVYAPPIVESANCYFNVVGGNHRAIDISGSTREEILEKVTKGIPVVIWATRDLQEARFNYSWYLQDTGEYFAAATNLHAYVINGYIQDKEVHIMDPLEGQVIYNMDQFFDSYYSLGSYAVIVVEK